jgi:superkiller protein 3
LGITYYNLENFQEAREQFTHSFELKPEFKDAVFNEAAAYIKLS